MGMIKDIVNGHVNEVLGKNQELFEKRIQICKKCGLYKDTPLGPVCNSKLYISNEDKTTISQTPKIGYVRGCSCRLHSKLRVSGARCIVNKW